jgi:hypothetical protein
MALKAFMLACLHLPQQWNTKKTLKQLPSVKYSKKRPIDANTAYYYQLQLLK